MFGKRLFTRFSQRFWISSERKNNRSSADLGSRLRTFSSLGRPIAVSKTSIAQKTPTISTPSRSSLKRSHAQSMKLARPRIRSTPRMLRCARAMSPPSPRTSALKWVPAVSASKRAHSVTASASVSVMIKARGRRFGSSGLPALPA